MNPSSRWRELGSVMVLQLWMLPCAYSCHLPRLTKVTLPQTAPASAPHNVSADGYDPRRDPEKDLAAASEEAKKVEQE